jgi:hypothetical protein
MLDQFSQQSLLRMANALDRIANKIDPVVPVTNEEVKKERRYMLVNVGETLKHCDEYYDIIKERWIPVSDLGGTILGQEEAPGKEFLSSMAIVRRLIK